MRQHLSFIVNRETIRAALAAMSTGNFLEKSKNLLATLGYRSELPLELSGTVDEFIAEFPSENPNTKTEQEFRKNVESVQLVFQFTSEQIPDDTQQALFESKTFNKRYTESFLFFFLPLC